MKTTPYFDKYVMAERPYISPQWCQQAIMKPIKRIIQSDGHIRHWTYIEEAKKYFRIVTLSDGETVHTAFFDRNFKE